MSILISVIIPVYNASAFISGCVESFSKQSLQNFELIFIDDCSKDDFVSVIEEYASKDKRIKLIKLSKNSGPMIAREVGYNHATAKYIVFCDADDVMPANALSLLYEKAISTDSDIVSGNIELSYPNGQTTLWGSHLNYGNDRNGVVKALLKGELRHNIIAKLYKRDLFSNFQYLSIPNLKYFEDYLLMLQIANNAMTVTQIDDIVYIYNQVATSSTHQDYNKKRVEDEISAHKFVYDMFISDKELSNYVISNCQRSLSRILAKGFPAQELVSKYGFLDILKISSMFKNNTLKDFVKMMIQTKILRFKSRLI